MVIEVVLLTPPSATWVVHHSAGRLFRRQIAGQVRSRGSDVWEPPRPQRSIWRKSSANAYSKILW